jgi:hypothetical protein
MVNQVKIKVADSTSTVPFNNTANAYYDMIITVQNISISQTINIYDVEGNLINDIPLAFYYPIKIVLKDVPLGSITFEDVNVYNVIISYVIKSNPDGIPYIDFDNETSVHAAITTVNSEYQASIYPPVRIDYLTLLDNADATNTNSVISIKSIYYQYNASVTGTYDNIIGIYDGFYTNLTDFFSVSVTSGNTYNVSINQSVYQYGTVQSNGVTGTSEGYILVPLPSPIVLMNGYYLFINDGETTNETEIDISYEVLS